jgi:toxin ParE1/3/4
MALIRQAFADLLDDPARSGVRTEPVLQAELGVYHLRHSRERAAAGGRVGSPRHYVVFRVVNGDELEIVRLLHDAMDLPSQLADL